MFLERLFMRLLFEELDVPLRTFHMSNPCSESFDPGADRIELSRNSVYNDNRISSLHKVYLPLHIIMLSMSVIYFSS